MSTAGLRARGFSDRSIGALVRTGGLHMVRRGVYTTPEMWQAWDEYRGRPLARVRAVGCGGGYVFSHGSAALIHDLPLLRPGEDGVHVSHPDQRATKRRHGVTHHGALFELEQVEIVDGLRALDIPRTVADIARQQGYRAGLVAADGALQLGVPRSRLQLAAGAMTGWPGSRTVAAVVAAADPGAESAAETLARELLTELGFIQIESQFPVPLGGGVAWIDLRVGCHLFEVDGFKKILQVEDGGVLRGEDPATVLWGERRRQQQVCGLGLGMSRLEWRDFFGRARVEVSRRLLAEEAVTRARYGDQLPPRLAEFAAQYRGQRYRAI